MIIYWHTILNINQYMSKYIGNTTFFEVKYIFNGYPEHDGGWEYNKIHFQKNTKIHLKIHWNTGFF